MPRARNAHLKACSRFRVVPTNAGRRAVHVQPESARSHLQQLHAQVASARASGRGYEPLCPTTCHQACRHVCLPSELTASGLKAMEHI